MYTEQQCNVATLLLGNFERELITCQLAFMVGFSAVEGEVTVKMLGKKRMTTKR